MATRGTSRAVEENFQQRLGKDVKPAEGRTRRALGDIGNVGGVTTRAQAAKGATKPTALKPRDPTATAAAALRSKAAHKGGSSLSSLLQSRSEYAAVKRQSAAPSPLSPLPDIDSKDKANPLAEAGYAHDIYCYYRRVEPRFAVPCDYMTSQVEVNEKMRSILIDWLIEVHLKFKLMPETLYLTCNLIDRYLSKRNVTRKRLQLVGVTAMLIASKYEEIWAPEVRDFVYISDKAYSREDILGCEKKMLEVLSYDLTVPTCYSFLARFKKAASCDDARASQVAEYLVELALVDYAMLKTPLSLISAAALHAALLSSGAADAYPRALRRHARYELKDVEPIARALVALAAKAPDSSLKAVYKKYSSTKFGEVAKMELPEIREAEAAA
ncbi:MAG: B type mitotic cyclin [Monoraphidium minutum]|nr:MAG: B type mitotic cyclin [Monoraphidium minutum]